MSNRLFPHEKRWVTQELTKIESRIRELGLELGIAMAQSSETWHDNGPADVIQNEVGALWSKRSWLLTEQSKMLCALPKNNDRIANGHIVVLKKNNQKIRIALGHINIAEYTNPIIGKDAPLHKAMLGKRVGETCAVGSTIYEVMSIELYSM